MEEYDSTGTARRNDRVEQKLAWGFKFSDQKGLEDCHGSARCQRGIDEMEQSAHVKEVLDSKEFRTWLPEKRFYLDLPKTTHFSSSAFLSLGLGSVFTLAFVREFHWYLVSIILSSTLFMIVYLMLVGYGETRILLADKEMLEICTMKEKFIKCRWEDILEVRKIKSGGFEILTSDGKAEIWWSPIPVGTNYSTFFREVFRAMASGISLSKLGKFRLPVELENGQTYIYKYKLGPRTKRSMYLLPLALYSGSSSLFSLVVSHERVADSWMRIVVCGLITILYCLDRFVSFTSQPGDTIQVADTQLVVTTKKGTETYVNQKIESSLEPSLAPIAFEKAERFGNQRRSLVVDRRFLDQVWQPKTRPTSLETARRER